MENFKKSFGEQIQNKFNFVHSLSLLPHTKTHKKVNKLLFKRSFSLTFTFASSDKVPLTNKLRQIFQVSHPFVRLLSQILLLFKCRTKTLPCYTKNISYLGICSFIHSTRLSFIFIFGEGWEWVTGRTR